MAESKSRIDLKIRIEGKGETLAELYRHLSPQTVQEICIKLPIYARIIKIGDERVCMLTQISSGVEKGRHNFKKGDIALFPADGYIYIFLKDFSLTRSMNHIGKIIEGIDILENIRVGDTVKIRSNK